MLENRHALDVTKDELKQMILQMSGMTAESLGRALECFKGCDPEAAKAIIENDKAIDELYEDIERHGFYLLASQQPVARDLREIVVAMRVASELERIADHAANIARIRLEIGEKDMGELFVSGIGKLGQDVLDMFGTAEASYSGLDTGKAEQLGDMEDDVDQSCSRLTTEIFDCMGKTPGLIEDGSRVLWIVHTLERIADRSTNIAEQVIYAVTAREANIN